MTTALLQARSEELVQRLVAAATEILDETGTVQPQHGAVQLLTAALADDRGPEAASGVPFVDWPVEAKRVLHLLAAGLRRRPGLVNERLSQIVDELIAQGVATGSLAAQAAALKVLILAGSTVAAATAARALRAPSGWLVDSAVAQVTSRPELVPLLPAADRIRYFAAIALGAGRLGLLRPRRSSDEPVRLASLVGTATAILFTLWLGLPWSRRAVTLRNGVRWPVNTIAFFAAAAAVYLFFIVVDLLLGIAGVEVHSLLSVALFAWPISALGYLALTPDPKMRDFVFPFVAVVQPAVLEARGWIGKFRLPAWRRSLIGTGLETAGGATALIAIGLGQNPTHLTAASPAADWHRWHLAIGILSATAFALFTSGAILNSRFNRQHDLAVLRDESATSELAGEDVFLRRLEDLRTYEGTSRFLSSLESRPRSETARYYRAVADLYRALEWISTTGIKELRTLDRSAWATAPHFELPGFRQWLERYSRRNSGRLVRLANNHRDTLARFLAQAIPVGSIGASQPPALPASPVTEPTT